MEHKSRTNLELHKMASAVVRFYGLEHEQQLLKAMNPKKLSPADIELLTRILTEAASGAHQQVPN